MLHSVLPMAGEAGGRRGVRGTALFVLAAALCAGAAPASGESTSMEDELRGVFEESSPADHPSLDVLRSEGVRYDGVAVAERTPRTGGYLVEARLSTNRGIVRFPVKLQRGDRGGWTIEWSPSRSYAAELVAFLEGETAKVSGELARPWADAERLPALPMIVGETTVVTPFGSVPVDGAGGVEPPPKLGKHVGRWVDSVLERDRGAAGLDLLVTPETPWRNVTRALFAGASAGLFSAHFVVRLRETDALAAVPTLAPVFESGRKPADDSSFLVAIDAARPAAIRVRVQGELLSGSDECGGDASLCDVDPVGFAEGLLGLVESHFEQGPPNVSHVMVAVSGAVEFADALSYAVQIPMALGIPSEKLFVGHVGERDGGRPQGGRP